MLGGWPALQLAQQLPPSCEHPFSVLTKSLSVARQPNRELGLAPAGQCSTCGIYLTPAGDFFPRESPPKWVRAAWMGTWEYELSGSSQ